MEKSLGQSETNFTFGGPAGNEKGNGSRFEVLVFRLFQLGFSSQGFIRPAVV